MGDCRMPRLREVVGTFFVVVLIFAAVTGGGYLLFAWSLHSYAMNCAGQMQACYASFRQATGSETAHDRARWNVSSEFSASARSIVFSVILGEGETALLFVDRDSGRQQIIYEPGFGFWAPYLSIDGERLVTIRRRKNTAEREILTCQIASWRCEVFLRTEDNLRSPIEIDKDTLLYASTPLRIGYEGRHLYADYDFHLLRKGEAAVHLSDFQLSELHSIGLAPDRIYFSAYGPKKDKPVIPSIYSKKITEDRSEVYSLGFDARGSKLLVSTEMLEPQFVIGGLSIGARISADGRWAAVQNTEFGKGKYRYEIVLVDLLNGEQQRLKTESIKTSPGVFVGGTVVFNELFPRHYEVKSFDIERKELSTVLRVDHLPGELRKLDRVPLTVGKWAS